MAKVLILEDDPDLAELYRRSLADAGHQVLGVNKSPREILARPPAEAPDLIILDERLGPASGLSVVPELRHAYPGARVLLATADREAAESAEADLVVMKPFSLRRLLSDVSSLMEER
jgi:DNA-binding response OmpR family regulator